MRDHSRFPLAFFSMLIDLVWETTCLERPLSWFPLTFFSMLIDLVWETTCHERPLSWFPLAFFSMLIDLVWETTCLERPLSWTLGPLFNVNWPAVGDHLSWETTFARWKWAVSQDRFWCIGIGKKVIKNTNYWLDYCRVIMNYELVSLLSVVLGWNESNIYFI